MTIKPPLKEILLVDDDEMNRSFLREFLEHMGYICEETENGSVALALLREKKFDLVITNHQMPIMSGLELLEHLHTHDDLQEIPTILLTGNLTKANVHRAIKAGAKEIFAKPFNPHVLALTITKILPHKVTKGNSTLSKIDNSIPGQQSNMSTGDKDLAPPLTLCGVWLTAVIFCLGSWTMISLLGRMILLSVFC